MDKVKTQQEMLDEQLKGQIKLLEKLSQMQEFKAWRDVIAKPLIEQAETNLINNSDQMDEITLRGNLKYLNMLKYLFYQVFETAKFTNKVTD